MNDLTSKALNLIRNDVKILETDHAKKMEELEDKIPMFIWMFRNNVDRKETIERLTELVDYGCLEAAKAVIQLKIGQDDEKGVLETLRMATED